MFKLAELFVEVGALTGPLDKTLAGVRGKIAALASTRVNVPMGGMLAGLLGGAGITAGIMHAVKAASDLNETMNMVNVAFGTSAKVITGAADEMSRKFGISKKQFLEGASAVGSMGKAMGMGSGMAAQFGTSVEKLAADFSSLKNVSLEDASRIFMSGLSGETEPLKRYGIMLTEVNVKQEAVRMGLVKAGQELTEQQKLQARYSLLLKGTADAQGDLDRTSAEYANQSRNLQGNLENLFATVGTALLPAANALVGGLSELVGAFLGAATGSDTLTQAGLTLAAWISDGMAVVRNFGDVISRTWTMISGYFSAGTTWLGETWYAMWSNLITEAMNAGGMIKDAVKEIWDYFRSMGNDPIELKFSLENLTKGTTLAPKFDLSDMENKLKAIDDRMAKRETERLTKKKEAEKTGPLAAKDLKFEKTDEKKAAKADIMSATSYSSMILKAALGKGDVAERTAKATEKTATLLEKMMGDFGKPKAPVAPVLV